MKHKHVYEHVRQMLGQVMLASPLRIEEITGILIMAIFAFYPSVSYQVWCSRVLIFLPNQEFEF